MLLYKSFFASKYETIVKGLEHNLRGYRSNLLSPLEGEILDVGSGTGVNFKYFSENTFITAIEPSQFMINQSVAKNRITNNIEILNYGVNDIDLLEKIGDKQFDHIVCTLALCTIENPVKAIDSFLKWLKPGGTLLIIEHIHSKKIINQILQNLINPIWKKIGDGCNLNRKTDELIIEAGFIEIEKQYFKNSIQFYWAIYKKRD